MATIGIVVVIIIVIVVGAYAALTLSSTKTTTSTTSTTPTTSSSILTTSSTTSSTPTTSQISSITSQITSTVSSSSSTTSAAGGTINIGILEPLTGFASEYGTTEQKAAQFAADAINAKGGINGQMIKIFAADEGSGGTQTINAFNQLVAQDHVNFIIGTDFSGDLLTILPLIEAQHVVTMSLSNSLDLLHNLINSTDSPAKYYFTLVYNDTYAGVSMVDNYVVPLGAKSVFITGEDFAYAHEVGNGSAAEAAAKGVTVVGQTYFPGDQLDFSSEVLNIANLGARAIILIASGSDSETFVKYLKQNPQTQNIPVINICCGDLTDPSIVNNLLSTGTNLNYISQQGWYYPMNFSSETPVFVKNWKAANNGAPPNLYTEGTAYDAVNMYAMAVQQAHGTNPDAVVSALQSMNYSGITGVIKFNSQNAVSFPPYIMPEYEFTNKTMVIFWPPNVANGTYVPPPGYTWTPPK